MENFKFYGNTKLVTRGKGNLLFEDGTKREGIFEVARRDDATLLFTARSQSTSMLDSLSSLSGRSNLIKITGTDNENKKIVITDLLEKNIDSHDNIHTGSVKEVTGYAGCCEIGKKEIKAGYTVRFELLNFLFTGNNSQSTLSISFPDIDFNIEQLEGYKTTKKILKRQGSVRSTSTIKIKVKDTYTLDDIYKQTHKLCRLLSVARSNWVTWQSVEILNTKNKTIYELHGDAITRAFCGNSLISEQSEQTVNFLNNAWSTYDKYKNVFDFERFLSGYIDTFVTTFIESRSLSLAVLVDFLSSRWALEEGKVFFIDQKMFAEQQKDLVKEIRKLLENKFDNLKDSYKHPMLSRIDGLNKRPLNWKLKRLRKQFQIPITDNEIEKFIEIRNSLAHRSLFPNGFDSQQSYLFMRHLLDRIILSVLGYEGKYFDMESRTEKTLK